MLIFLCFLFSRYSTVIKLPFRYHFWYLQANLFHMLIFEVFTTTPMYSYSKLGNWDSCKYTGILALLHFLMLNKDLPSSVSGVHRRKKTYSVHKRAHTHTHTHLYLPCRLLSWRVRWADGLCVTAVTTFDPDVLNVRGKDLASVVQKKKKKKDIEFRSQIQEGPTKPWFILNEPFFLELLMPLTVQFQQLSTDSLEQRWLVLNIIQEDMFTKQRWWLHCSSSISLVGRREYEKDRVMKCLSDQGIGRMETPSELPESTLAGIHQAKRYNHFSPWSSGEPHVCALWDSL